MNNKKLKRLVGFLMLAAGLVLAVVSGAHIGATTPGAQDISPESAAIYGGVIGALIGALGVALAGCFAGFAATGASMMIKAVAKVLSNGDFSELDGPGGLFGASVMMAMIIFLEFFFAAGVGCQLGMWALALAVIGGPIIASGLSDKSAYC